MGDEVTMEMVVEKSREKSGTSVRRKSSDQVGKTNSTIVPADERSSVLESHGFFLGTTLGKGSYAIVKEAYSKRMKSKVAIKIISKAKAPVDYLQKFLPREVEVVKVVKHPNLVVFILGIETRSRMFLVMEYVPNGDLLGVLRKLKVIQLYTLSIFVYASSLLKAQSANKKF